MDVSSGVSYAALDFETADPYPESVCAVGVVSVVKDRMATRFQAVVQPFVAEYSLAWIHGITASETKRAPRFDAIWPRVRPLLTGASFVAAHNAEFDRMVLLSALRRARIPAPTVHFVCTMRLAQILWPNRRSSLPAVCERLEFDLDHHNALSDAEACSAIVAMAQQRIGVIPSEAFLEPLKSPEDA